MRRRERNERRTVAMARRGANADRRMRIERLSGAAIPGGDRRDRLLVVEAFPDEEVGGGPPPVLAERQPPASAKLGHRLGYRPPVPVEQVEDQPLEIARDLDVH